MTRAIHRSRRGSGRSCRGSALIAVYWVIAILAMAVFTGAQFLLAELETRSSVTLEFRAEQLADAGVALAASPQVERWDPLLSQEVSATERFTARLVSEGARLNPNFLAGTDEGRMALARLFREFGLSDFDALSLAAAMGDWIDADEVEQPWGAERLHYRARGLRGMPFNRPFADLEELLWVRGFEEVASAYPGWRELFTLFSQGPLDLADAPAELIAAVCGCALGNAQRFVRTRAGRDGVEGTEDDLKFASAGEALDLLGLEGPVKREVENLVSVGEGGVRIISTGTIGDISVERSVVLRDRTEDPSVVEVRTRRIR